MTELRHANRKYEPVHYSTRKEWDEYANWLKRHMKVSLALLPEPARTPLKAKVFGKWEGQGYTCEKVHFESMPGFFVTGNLFRPLERSKKKHPGILCPHGHWPDGRLHDRDPAGSVIARCIQFARMGATVFSYDMTGHNDSCQLKHRAFPTDSHWSLSMMAVQTWNSIRAVDFLLGLPEVAPRRIGVTGTSGGGTQTFTLTAVEDRIQAAAPICMISYRMQGGCICENAPFLRIDATSVDIARLCAPRPMFMGSCTGDWTRNTLREELPAVRNIYKLHAAQNRLMNHHVDFRHNYNQEMREHVYGFFNKFLFGGKSARPIKEQEVPRPSHRDRMVWWGRNAPEPITYRQFRETWRARRRKTLNPLLRNAGTVRKELGKLLPHALGVTLHSVDQFTKSKPRTTRFHLENTQLVVEPMKPPKHYDAPDPFFESYNRTLFADRVHEILAALKNVSGRVELNGVRGAGPAVLAAAALSRKVKSVTADMCGFDPDKDRDWKKYFNTPAIRQIGGLATIFACIGKRPVNLLNATGRVLRMARAYAQAGTQTGA